MRALLLSFAAALFLGCNAVEFNFPATNQTELPSAGNALSYGTEMMMMFTNMTTSKLQSASLLKAYCNSLSLSCSPM